MHEQGNFRKIIPLETCLIAGRNMVDGMLEVDEWVKEFGLKGYDKDAHEGLLRHLMVRESFATDEMMLALFATKTPDGELASAVENLVERITKMGKPKEDEKMIDLFCGVGTFSLPFAARVKELAGIEIVEKSIESAKRNAIDNDMHNKTFLACDARRGLNEMHDHFGFADILLIDPPRSGAGGKVMRRIGRLRDTPAPVALEPDSNLTKVVDGMEVTLSHDLKAGHDTSLTLTIKDAKTKKPITDLEQYLGAIGHVVIISEGGNYLHVHPINAQDTGPQAWFMATIPTSDIYKIWGQFQHKGKVFTVPFVVKVS